MERININFPLNLEQTKAREALILSLKNNPKIQSFLHEHHLSESFVDQRAQMLADYLKHAQPCVGCKGLAFCTQAKTGFVLGLEVEPLINWELQACAYQVAQDLKTEHKKNYVRLDVADVFLEASLENLTDHCEDSAYLVSIQPISAWLKSSQTKGFYFYGAPGSGKTHCAMAIGNYFAKLGKKVAMVSVPSLAMQFPNSYSENEAKDVLVAQLKKAHLVIFDDIGAESYTSWFRDEILFPVLNARMEATKLTFFTSNHSLEALKVHFRYNQKADDEAVKSMRMMERITALANPLHLMGKNRRG